VVARKGFWFHEANPIWVALVAIVPTSGPPAFIEQTFQHSSLGISHLDAESAAASCPRADQNV